MDTIIGLMFIGAIVVMYFIPAIVAHEKYHKNAGAIIVLNLFLGWTFIGWVLSLVWAFTDNIDKEGEAKRLAEEEVRRLATEKIMRENTKNAEEAFNGTKQ